jgi:transcription elongation factor GreB
MSKAFTRESDDAPDLPLPSRPAALLPPGAKNYLTPGGALRLRAELEQLVTHERPRVASLTDDSDAKRQLQLINQRITQLQYALQTAAITGPPSVSDEVVHFGATVTVCDQRGEESRYRIVGVDEIDLDRDWVSWLSPLARSLLNARVGDRVRLKLPAGEEELEVLSVSYE